MLRSRALLQGRPDRTRTEVGLQGFDELIKYFHVGAFDSNFTQNVVRYDNYYVTLLNHE